MRTVHAHNSQHQDQPKCRRPRRAWQPEARDHLIYQWVKFAGKTQTHAAADFDISQATVSRIIDRYERWQAHADPREGGRLDPTERLWAQRWLTYERNELIIASSLRIADRMEGVTELHKSVRTKPLREWHKEGTEIRSEEQSVDRHGVAARFLRLAFRVNMEQLKLVEKEAPPMPQPLTATEVADEERRDAAVAAAFLEAERRSAEQDAKRAEEKAAAEAAANELAEQERQERGELQRELAGQSLLKLHNLHNGSLYETVVTDCLAWTWAADSPEEKSAEDACIEDHEGRTTPPAGAAPLPFSEWVACPTGGG
jgi:hypothetical protein